MARIVAGFGTAHIMMKRGSAGDAGERVFGGMKEIGRRIRAAKPDILVIVSSDHLYNYDLAILPPFGIATDAEHTPYGDMSLPTDVIPGHAQFADGFLRFAADHDADFARLVGYRVDHGIVLPALIASPTRDIPVVPIIINTAMEPVPSLARAYKLGQLLRTYAQTRPGEERVVVVGAGGLSHWLGVPEMGRVNEGFDRAVLDALVLGTPEQLTSWSREQVLREGGNGGQEILNWLFMAGSVGPARGELVYYEVVPEWVTGMGGLHLTPEQ
jgi:2'-aminobiphenyl-2,3-diol 1,2-dioxygenase, large subunit